MDNKRSELIANILPEIPGIHNREVGEKENFQNEVLRPILKFQNEIILKLFLHSIQELGKINLYKIDPVDLNKKITQELTNNQKIRNQFLGMILALMSTAQLEDYFKNEQEYRKRVFSMLKERILDGLQTIIPQTKTTPT